MEMNKDVNLLLDYSLFWNWLCCARDYTFKGGKKPVNNFPEFFYLYVYENASYVNKPDNIMKKDSKKIHSFNSNVHFLHYQNYIKDYTEEAESSSFGLFMLKCLWNDFLYETVAPFHKESKVGYFARNIDTLQWDEDSIHYEITLKMDNHIGKVYFIMPNVENKYEDAIDVNTRVFLPKLHLIFKGTENFEIIYHQNKDGIGFESNNHKDPISNDPTEDMNPDSEMDITTQKPDYFYFNKPFYIHVLVDNLNLLSLYVAQTTQI